MPVRANVLHPQKTTLVWIARSRPKESHGTARRSGQFSFSDATSPAAVPTRSHTVAHATYSYAIRTAAGSATSEGPTGAPKPRFWTMGANGSPAVGGCQANVRDGPATKKSRPRLDPNRSPARRPVLAHPPPRAEGRRRPPLPPGGCRGDSPLPEPSVNGRREKGRTVLDSLPRRA